MIYTMIILALSLSIDSFVIAASIGVKQAGHTIFHALKIAVIFACFQTALPFIGMMAGDAMFSYIEQVDHWIGFLLLSFVGLMYIYEAYHPSQEDKPQVLDTKVLCTLALATSLDAFAVGLLFPVLGVPRLGMFITIAITTAVMTLSGLALGGAISEKRSTYLEVLAGVVLLFLGIHMLWTHIG